MIPAFNEEWLGQPLAVLRVPTIGGAMSFAMRWHGARPALLWEVDGDRPFTMTCHAIDPNWSTSERRGEVLLEAPVIDHVHDDHHDHAKPVAQPPIDGGGSFS